MAITPEIIHYHLTHLPQRRSLDAALELFDALGYQYADELPLPIRNWPDGVQRLVNRNSSSGPSGRRLAAACFAVERGGIAEMRSRNFAHLRLAPLNPTAR